MQADHEPPRGGLPTLTLAALGVVYGDIGTSPLYAFKEAFAGVHGLAPSPVTVLATLSALFWAVMIIISLKYVWIMLHFDNEGEGGVLALTALAHRLSVRKGSTGAVIVTLGIFAAALFYGDAIITPAISVLSAIEGLSIAAPSLSHTVVPMTVAVIVALFFIQRHGTASVGRWFGPITVLWFATLAVLGARSIAHTPMVLRAINPLHALSFAAAEPAAAFLLLASVFLALTGGEALYADMGHFGARPVRYAWYGLVCPALLINYFGQGALVLRDAAAVKNPFYLLAPDYLLYPLIGLATLATVIASQATITGAYSLTVQASRLGYLPRMHVLHTSDTQRGQVYLPTVNWVMLIAVIVLVGHFRSSGALAAAYGIAVSGTMLITTTLTVYVALRLRAKWRRVLIFVLLACGILELLFFGSNLAKIAHGGWLPLLLAFVIFVMLTTWKEGTRLIHAHRRLIDIAMPDFVRDPLPDVPRVPGTAVYLTSDPDSVPSALFHNIKYYQVMHERIVFLHVLTEETPTVPEHARLTVTDLGGGMYDATARFGFREEPDVPQALSQCPRFGLILEPMATTYFVARTTVADGPGDLPAWRTRLYAWMMRQAEGAANYFKLPPNRVVELGTQVLL